MNGKDSLVANQALKIKGAKLWLSLGIFFFLVSVILMVLAKKFTQYEVALGMFGAVLLLVAVSLVLFNFVKLLFLKAKEKLDQRARAKERLPQTKQLEVKLAPSTADKGGKPETKNLKGRLPQAKGAKGRLAQAKSTRGRLPQIRQTKESLPQIKQIKESLPKIKYIGEALPQIKEVIESDPNIFVNVDGDLSWLLKDRWGMSRKRSEGNNDGFFPKWYFDEVTDRQIRKLESLDIVCQGVTLNKGMASDLIGLSEDIGEHQKEILRFFKRSYRGMSESRAKHEIDVLFNDEDNVAAWSARPPKPMQKEFAKFFGIKFPKGTTLKEAEVLISSEEERMIEQDDPKYLEWENFEQILSDLEDAEECETYGIKKPSKKLIRDAVGELLSQGRSYKDMAEEIEILVDEMIIINPKIERN